MSIFGGECILWAALFNQYLCSWCEVAGLVLAVAYSREVEGLEDVSSTAQTPLLPTSVSFIEF